MTKNQPGKTQVQPKGSSPHDRKMVVMTITDVVCCFAFLLVCPCPKPKKENKIEKERERQLNDGVSK